MGCTSSSMGGGARSKCVRAWLSALSLALIFSTAAFATNAKPLDDAHTSSAASTVPLGAAPELDVSQSPIQSSYLRFDLSSLPAGTTSADVGAARIRLFVLSVAAPGDLSINPV